MRFGKREQQLMVSFGMLLAAYFGWNFSPEIERAMVSLFGGDTAVSQNPSVTIPDTAYVKRVIDGDTFELATGEVVRLIGIDAPESVKPGEAVQCFGPEASAFLKDLVLHHEIRMERDTSETDRYGRLLRYVYLEERLVNETLVREGYARAKAYRPDIAKQNIFTAAQEKASAENRGLWNESVCPD